MRLYLDVESVGRIGKERIFKLKEPKMKKEELNFKVLTPTEGRAAFILRALDGAGIPRPSRIPYSTVQAVRVMRGETVVWVHNPFKGPANFDASLAPEVTFERAIELINQVETEPEFNIKPFDKILRWSARSKGPWKIGFYSHPEMMEFEGLNSTTIDRMVLFEGNEHLLNKSDLPDGWWECCDGKPVWRNK